MARKSKAQIERETKARMEEINEASTAKAMDLFQTFMAKFMDARGAAGPGAVQGTPTDDRKLAESLAHAMMTASASPSKRATLVTPEERAAREAAKVELIDLLTKNHAQGLVPIYRITKKTFLAETLIDPQFRDPQTKQMVDQEVNWRGVPNQAMTWVTRVPNNGKEEESINAGQAVYALYQRMIGAPVMNANTPSPWVTSGKEILRGNPSPAPSPMSHIAPGDDPRRLGATQGATTIRLLGKTAAPAVVTP